MPEAELGNRPLSTADAGSIGSLRVALDTAGYSEAGVREALGLDKDLALQRANVPMHLRRLPKDSTISPLIKLFLLGVTVSVDEATRALAPADPLALAAIGLLEYAASEVRSQVQLYPYQGLYFASDRYHWNLNELTFDYVTNVNPTSITLANLTVREPAKSALDVGTGCGVQALLAAQHCEQVTAVDISPRALAFAGFNAELNGLTNIECRQGSFFQPVEGSSFDLIVCNPPYVVSPESEYQFRDSGLPGDAVSRDVIGQAPGQLREGGFAHVLCNWGLREGEDWSEPLKRWLDGTGCDALLLHAKTDDPLTYAAGWNPQRGATDPAGYDNTLDRWLEYYKQLGIEGIASGAVILRRSSGQNWIHEEELPPGSVGPSGEHLLRIFRALDYLTGLKDESAVLEGAFVLAEHHRLEQQVSLDRGKMTVLSAQLRFDRGLDFQGNVDAHVLSLLSRCDGRPLKDIVDEQAAAMELDRETLAAAVVPVVHRLLTTGFLERTQSWKEG